MRKLFRQLGVIFVATCIFFLSATPALADESSNPDDGKEYIQRANWWHWVYRDADETDKSSFLYRILSYSEGSICPNAEDGYHKASSYLEFKKPLIGDPYYSCICEHCGHTFKAYETDLKQSYEAQVSEMPATGYNSDGSMLIYPQHQFIFGHYRSTWDGSFYSGCPHFEPDAYYGSSTHNESSNSSPSGYRFKGEFDCENGSAIFHPLSGASYFYLNPVSFYYVFEFPVDGYCSFPAFSGISGFCRSSSGESASLDKPYGGSSSSTFRNAGDTFVFNFSFDSKFSSTYSYISVKCAVPVCKVVPLTSIDTSTDITYNISTRPTSITGNYGIIGDDGKLVQVTGNTIVNETSNTYYNPATGETTPITSWSYDYSDRSYTVTKEDGDTTTITYGDENVTITEGDTVYNIYYIVNGSGSGEGEDPSTCTHDWTETSRTPPTCTAPGEIAYTCGLCGETKTEAIAATGHTWTETSRTDPTCTTPGQASYSCSKCGETKTETLKPTGHTWEVERTVQTTFFFLLNTCHVIVQPGLQNQDLSFRRLGSALRFVASVHNAVVVVLCHEAGFLLLVQLGAQCFYQMRLDTPHG